LTKVSPHPRLTRAHAAQSGVTLGLEQGELGADFTPLGRKLLKQKGKGDLENQIKRIKWLAYTKKATKLRESLRWQKVSMFPESAGAEWLLLFWKLIIFTGSATGAQDSRYVTSAPRLTPWRKNKRL
jgi:hypothetical protein